MGMSKKVFLYTFTLIIILAFFLRFYNLDIKPMHHDEGVQQHYYIQPLLENRALDYLGTEYHGLLPHFLSYPFIKIFGISPFSLRFTGSLFGALTIFLLFFLRKYIGNMGVLFSAAFLAISPIFVYYSRQYTGYPFYIFFLLLFIIFGLKFFDEQKRHYLYFAAATAALILNINEAFLIFIFILAAFLYINYLFKEDSFNEKLNTLKKIKLKYFILLFLFSFSFSQ